MEKVFITNRPSQTRKLGAVFAKEVLGRRDFSVGGGKRAIVIGLAGDLGSGKTTFLQGFARGLGIKEKILSPTFVLMKKFPINRERFFYHMDCYRIQKPKDILALNFKEIVADHRNVIVIEWADLIKKILPRGSVWIKFEFINNTKRKIAVLK